MDSLAVLWIDFQFAYCRSGMVDRLARTTFLYSYNIGVYRRHEKYEHKFFDPIFFANRRSKNWDLKTNSDPFFLWLQTQQELYQ